MQCCGSPGNVSSPDNPYLMGEANGQLLRARVTVATAGLTAGDVGWFTGTDVDAWVHERILVPVG